MNNELTHTETEVQIMCCDSCSYFIQHGDDGMDVDALAYVLPTMTANVERYGWTTEVGTLDLGGYWECDLCWETNIGQGTVFEATRPVD